MFGYGNKIVLEDLERIYQTNISWNTFNGKTVLVTGANSMLGTYAAYFFLFLAKEKGIAVKTVVLTRTLSKTEELYRGFLESDYFDIINQDIVRPIDYKENVDYIFHFAGNASPKFINSDPVGILKSNLIGTINVLEFAKEKHSSRLLFASTREVYGAVSASLLTEKSFGYLDPMENRSCYPESKRAAESLLRSYFIQYGVDSVSIRIAHSYGPGMKINNDGRVMADFVSNAVNGQNIVLKSTGDDIRAFCYVSDAVSGMLLALLKGSAGEAYNLANESEPYPIRDVAQLICSIFPERNINVVFDCGHKNTGYCNYPRVALDISKISALGYSPIVALKEGVYRTIRSFD